MYVKEALLLSHQAILASYISAQSSGRGCELSMCSLYREIWKDHGAWLCDGVQELIRVAFRPYRISCAEFTDVPIISECPAASHRACTRPLGMDSDDDGFDCNADGKSQTVVLGKQNGEEQENMEQKEAVYWRLAVYEQCLRGMREVDSLLPMAGLEPAEGYMQALAAATGHEISGWVAALSDAARPETGPGAGAGEGETTRIGTVLYLQHKMAALCRQVRRLR
jgi:hypothetical protein